MIMKKMKQVLSLILVLCLLLSCVVHATPGTETDAVVEELGHVEESALNKGVFSKEFRANNAYQYAKDQTVRAIVVLDGAPEADFEGTEAQRSAYSIKLKNAQKSVRKAMSAVDYELVYEFTTLLNGFSCDVAYGDLETIARIPGVSSVHIANSYAEPVLQEPENKYSGLMMGNSAMNNAGYNGKGIVVAVLDTGLRTSHQAFKVYNNMALTQVLTSSSLSKASVSAKYLSAKVPFAYDYADGDNNVDDKNGHGTHVSGTAVGYAEGSDGAVILSGGAPAAQLVAMKIFKDEGGGTSSDIYFYALEDAYRLGMDVVNMSIGAQNGFTYDESLETDVFGNIYKRMENAGIVMCVAAGNEYSMAEYSSVGFIGTEYTDFGTIASPAGYEGNISIAAVENYAYPDYSIQVDSQNLGFTDNCEDGTHGWVQTFGGKTVNIVVLKNSAGTDLAYGSTSDYSSVNVKNKIVVVSRGELSFQEKVDNAANAGAAGVIVVNNAAGSLGMIIDPYAIPAIAMTQDTKSVFLGLAQNSSVTTSKAKSYLSNPNAYQMSDFSNWGTSPMLTIDPTISSVGGMVYSASITADDAYEVMSGTSMASPNAAGSFACLLQALNAFGAVKESGASRTALSKVERKDRAIDLMASTGIILQDAEDYIYSVRKQGAGLINTANAANTFLSGAYLTNPIQELGDDKNKTGVYTMDLELVNEGYETVTYDRFNAYILFDMVEKNGNAYVNTMTSGLLYAGQEGNATVTYTQNGKAISSITLNPGEKKTIHVVVTLDDTVKAYYDSCFPNGSYVEGYIFFENTVAEDSDDLSLSTHATFLAYYGDWLQAPALESLNSFHYLQALYALNHEKLENDKTYAENGYSVWDVILDKYGMFYTDLNWVYTTNSEGKANNYLGGNLMDPENTQYLSVHNAISTAASNGDYVYSIGMTVTPNLLRNVRHIVMKVTDKKTGTVYLSDDTEYVPKDYYDNENSSWSYTSLFTWNGTKADGKTYVPSGTVVTVSFDIQLPYGEASNTWTRNAWTFDMTVDYTAPTIESAVYDASAKTLTVRAKDENYLAGIYLCSTDYKTIYDQKTMSSDKSGESFEAVFDVSGVSGKELIAVAMDYATNERRQTVKLDASAKPSVLTLVTAEGTQTMTSYVGESVTLPSANGYDGYAFQGWVSAKVSSSTTKPTTYASGSSYSLTAQVHTLYALYAKTDGSPVTYTREKTDNFRGSWAFVGYPYDADQGKFLPDEPVAMGKSGASVDITSLSDGKIYAGQNKFATQVAGITYTLTYYTNYSSYCLYNADTGMYLLAYKGELLEESKVYLESLWTITSNSDGSVLCTNYNDKNAVLLYNDASGKFQVFDNSQQIVSGYYPTDFYALYMYRRAENTVKIEYYTTELSICQIKGHSYESVVTEATCTTGGYTTHTCTVCGSSYASDRVNPKGHSYESVTTQPTCTVGGYTTYTCTACGDSYVDDRTEPAEHTYHAVVTEATCTTAGYTTYTCTVCGYSYVGDQTEPTQHAYEAAVTEATCISGGYTTYTCSVCGDNYVDAITEPTGHNYDAVVTEPNCTDSGYTTYTCTACGDSYMGDITPAYGHSYVYTSQGETHLKYCHCGRSFTETHEYVNGKCVCGKVEIQLAMYHTLDLASDISVSFAVIATDLNTVCTESYLECVLPVYSGNVQTGTKTVQVSPVEKNGMYYYTLTGLDATKMNDMVSAKLYGATNGEAYLLLTDEYSIATYAYAQLRKDYAPAALKALCADLLRYGAKAQIYKNYRTDELADAQMTEAQQSYLTELDTVSFANVKSQLNDCANIQAKWSGVGLDLQSKVTVRFVVDCSGYGEDVSDLALAVSYTNIRGEQVTVMVENPQPYYGSQSYYVFDFDGLLAAELRSVLSACVYADGVKVSNTLTYSPDTYGNGKTGDLLTLCRALVAYSDSAKAYFTAQ